MKALLFIWTLCCCLSANALQLIPFRSEDHKLKVHHMDSVLILADSAYVISGAHAQLINGKLAELHGAYDAHARLLDVNAGLEQVMEIERLVLQLMQKMHEDQELMTVRVNAPLPSWTDTSGSYRLQTHTSMSKISPCSINWMPWSRPSDG